MNVAKMVADYLKTRTSVTALTTAGRIYWGEEPPAAAPKPTVRVTLINGNRLHNLDYAFPDVQVSVFDKTKEGAEALKEVLIAELRDARVVMGSTGVTAVYQDDRTFRQTDWWHAPITFGLRLQEE